MRHRAQSQVPEVQDGRLVGDSWYWQSRRHAPPRHNAMCGVYFWPDPRRCSTGAHCAIPDVTEGCSLATTSRLRIAR